MLEGGDSKKILTKITIDLEAGTQDLLQLYDCFESKNSLGSRLVGQKAPYLHLPQIESKWILQPKEL